MGAVLTSFPRFPTEHSSGSDQRKALDLAQKMKPKEAPSFAQAEPPASK